MHVQIVVSAPSGAVLGHVRTSGRAYSSSGWLDVFNADNRLVYSVQGEQCPRFWLAGLSLFAVFKDEVEVLLVQLLICLTLQVGLSRDECRV